mmetsp:Transcript_4799/g.10254  ORF Transcript_4799/g.10254 Transcript_4799/m.10254 type:complete len:353 (+) Transcript_4799:2102-3160(+)
MMHILNHFVHVLLVLIIIMRIASILFFLHRRDHVPNSCFRIAHSALLLRSLNLHPEPLLLFRVILNRIHHFLLLLTNTTTRSAASPLWALMHWPLSIQLIHHAPHRSLLRSQHIRPLNLCSIQRIPPHIHKHLHNLLLLIHPLQHHPHAFLTRQLLRNLTHQRRKVPRAACRFRLARVPREAFVVTVPETVHHHHNHHLHDPRCPQLRPAALHVGHGDDQHAGREQRVRFVEVLVRARGVCRAQCGQCEHGQREVHVRERAQEPDEHHGVDGNVPRDVRVFDRVRGGDPRQRDVRGLDGWSPDAFAVWVGDQWVVCGEQVTVLVLAREHTTQDFEQHEEQNKHARARDERRE